MANSAAVDQNYYVQLSSSAIRFEPISKATNVFYDEVKRQVSVINIAVVHISYIA